MPMPPILLTEDDVARLVDMPLALAAVEEALGALARGDAENVTRARAKAPGVVLHSMSAAAGYLGVVGWKNYTTTRAGAKFLVGLRAADTGDLLALIEADRLGHFRTGAATGVAIRHLGAEGIDRLGLFGAGRQAETQLLAACHARPIREAIVYCRTAERREQFAERMQRRLREELGREVRIQATDDPQAAAGAGLVITATTSREPLFPVEMLAPNALVCAVGSNWPNRAEVGPDVVAAAQSVVCDRVAACRIEAGELIQAADAGKLDWSRAVELADVVAGNAAVSSHGKRLFKSVGLAIEDVALGFRLVELARQRGIGHPLPF